MKTAQEWASMFNGQSYGSETTLEEEAGMREQGFVAVFGYSDDGIEFRGAINDEDSAPAIHYINADGLMKSECREGGHECSYFIKAREGAATIEAKWGDGTDGAPAWVYVTEIPHAKFMIYEDGEPFCEGIVFNLGDVKTLA